MEAPDLRIAALPLDTQWANIGANLASAEQMLDQGVAAGTDVAVLPELFATGYVSDPQLLQELGQDNNGPIMSWVGEQARRRCMALAGTFIARNMADGTVRNRAFLVEPSGDRWFYDKRHLFSLSAEAKLYTAGTALPPAMRFRGWNLSMIVCYDLRFPAWCRKTLRNPYDVMLVPANWPTARGFAWQQLLSARAIENQAVWVGADRGGHDDYGQYDGLAQIVDALGRPTGTADSRTGVINAVVSRAALNQTRQCLPVANDADRFQIQV